MFSWVLLAAFARAAAPPPAPGPVPAIAIRPDGTIDTWAADLWQHRGRLLELAPLPEPPPRP